MEFLRVFGSLVLVLGLLGGLLWGLKRLQMKVQGAGPTGRRLQVLDSLSLGPRQKLALVRVGVHEVLVGVSPGQITALGQWPADSSPSLAAPSFEEEVRRAL